MAAEKTQGRLAVFFRRCVLTLLYSVYLLVITVVLLGLLEGLLRLGYFRPAFNMNGLEIVLDRAILYRIRPESRRDINNWGFRGEPFHVWKKYGKRILFQGDSFVFGTNVMNEQTMPHALGERLRGRYEVYNLGIQGYGPDQSLIQLKQDGLYLDPDIVVLAVYPDNDFNDLLKNRLFRVDEDGTLRPERRNVVEAGLPPLDLITLLRYARVKRAGRNDPGMMVFDAVYGKENKDLYFKLFGDYHDPDLPMHPESASAQDKIALMRAVLSEYKRVLEARGIAFHVVIIPSQANMEEGDNWMKDQKISRDLYFFNEDTVAGICRDLGISYTNLYLEFLERKRRDKDLLLFDISDGHLNSTAYGYVADTLARKILDYEAAGTFSG